MALALLLAVHSGVYAETWFLIAGDVGDAASETVQVSPDTVVVFANLRMMKLRTSRSISRIGYDGRPYRSYVSIVQIDCDKKQAGFRKLELFEGPLWTGANRTVDYTEADMPRMRFLDMQPNPTARIVQAACVVGSVQTR